MRLDRETLRMDTPEEAEEAFEILNEELDELAESIEALARKLDTASSAEKPPIQAELDGLEACHRRISDLILVAMERMTSEYETARDNHTDDSRLFASWVIAEA